MNTENLGNNLDGTPVMPVKRKRGRPRKDKSQIPGRSAIVQPRLDRNHDRDQIVNVPPGFQGVNGNQRNDAVQDSEDNMVGQVVTGVIEGTFDAGYLLSVRFGDSETILRGAVFKPGRYVPISAKNDVVPHIQMIRRTEVPFPSATQARGRGNYRLTREKIGSAPANQLALTGQSVPPIAASQAPPVGARGTVVPVLLQPVNLSNGAPPIRESPPITSQPAHLAVSRNKKVAETNHEVAPKNLQTDGNLSSKPGKEVHTTEREKSNPGLPFEELVSEVVKRVQGSPHSVESEHQESAKSSKDAGLTAEQTEDQSPSLMVEPLQSIHSNDPSGPVPRSFHDMRNFTDLKTGKMTELLLAVQENLIENQMEQQNLKKD